ncbi:MAG: hypothetical protein EOP85_11055 [Verrucomicrobiaceae bacterium]|nr:MAG: hypothetical protein EOP85_11055 [Verrucomicrobiaceae bacterium]
MKTLLAFLTIPVLLVSCASDGNDKSTSAAPQRKKLEQRVLEEGGYKKDASGNWVPRSDKRSSFESQGESQFAKKDFKKQQYKAGDYATKSWWGNKEYDRKTFAGNTDGSRFQKASNLDGKGARETTTSFKTPDNYETGSYATTSARESGATRIKKTSNDLIENRRDSFEQPEITDWRQQRTVQRGLFGR